MKLNRNVTALAIVGAGVAVWLVMRGDDPVTTARLKCEHHVESLTGYDLSIGEVSGLVVAGDIFDGRVYGSFNRSGSRRAVECVFQKGSTARVMVDGKVLAGR